MTDLSDRMVEAACDAVSDKTGTARDWDNIKKYWQEQADRRRQNQRDALIAALRELMDDDDSGDIKSLLIALEAKETTP